MSREAPADADMVSDEELTELLANAEGTTPEEIERGAAELEIAPPEEATVGVPDHVPLTGGNEAREASLS
jgi:hypothetical protein